MKRTARFEIANKPEHVGGPLRHAVPNRVPARLLEKYESSLATARGRFDQHAAVRALFHDPIDPVTLERFLISFAIIGVHMTEPVEGWTPVNFDKPRKSTSAPALAVFEGQLKCAYRDADKSRYVILTYQPAQGLSGISIPSRGPGLRTTRFPISKPAPLLWPRWRLPQDPGSWPLAV